MIRLALSVVIGLGIVGGQLCLASFARGLTAPWEVRNLFSQAIASPSLYGAALLYSGAIGLYLGLLRTGAVSSTNLPIMAVVILLNIAMAFSPGEALNNIQIAGAIFVGIGLLLLQSA